MKQSIIEGDLETYNAAKIRLLDYNIGTNTHRDLLIDEEYNYNNDISIILRECKKDSKRYFKSIKHGFNFNQKEDKVIYEGWIFSKNSAISLPKVEDKFIYLTSCENQPNN